MDLSLHRAGRLAWGFAAAALVAAAAIVVLHWSPSLEGQRRGLEVLGLVLLGVSALGALVVEGRRQRRLDRLTD